MNVNDLMLDYLRFIDTEDSRDHRNEDGSDKSFHASTFFECLRKRWLARQPHIKRAEIDAPLLFRFKQGNLWEELYARAFMWKGILLEREVPLRDGEFSGRVDFLITPTEGLGIVELKTVHPFALNIIKSKGMYKHHKAQVMWYFDVMKRTEQWKEVSFMKLIYAGIADSRCMEFNIPYDPYFIEEIEADKAKLLDYYNNNIEPATLEKGNWQCKRCVFYETYCKEDQEAGLNNIEL
ncbi:MAG: PD-(D/E)XK nuclease family protein [Gammaproteobacteria bacterium]|nr:PD-(D/E)XK nuclease family protein [Gammaproteobacteria bacterium]